MIKIIIFCGLLFFSLSTQAQISENSKGEQDSLTKTMIVDASCGQCQFGMDGSGCELAVKIKGKSYLVEGVPAMNSYGNPHGEDGMCNVVRKAEVAGSVKGKKFVATSFKLLPLAKKTD